MSKINKTQHKAIEQFSAALAERGFNTEVRADGGITINFSAKEQMTLRLDFDESVVKIRSHTKVKGEWVHSAIRVAKNVRYFYRIMRQMGAPISGQHA